MRGVLHLLLLLLLLPLLLMVVVVQNGPINIGQPLKRVHGCDGDALADQCCHRAGPRMAGELRCREGVLVGSLAGVLVGAAVAKPRSASPARRVKPVHATLDASHRDGVSATLSEGDSNQPFGARPRSHSAGILSAPSARTASAPRAMRQGSRRGRPGVEEIIAD